MSRQEFLTILKEALEMELSPQEVTQNINYYSNYIADEAAKGMPEEEVLARLGDPRMIAKSIVEAANAGKESDYERNSYENNRYDENNYERKTQENSYRNNAGGTQFNYSRNGKTYHVSGRTAGIIAISVLVLIVVLLVWIIGGILTLLLPVLVPVILILIGIKLLRRR